MGRSFDGARHLLARTAFGEDPDEVRGWIHLDRHQTVDRVLACSTGLRLPRTKLSQRAATATGRARTPPPEAGQAFQEQRRQDIKEPTQWWYPGMVATPSPMTERMTLVSHHHSTSSLYKVKWLPYAFAKTALYRRGH